MANSSAHGTMRLEVFRYSPETTDGPHFQTYEVPYRKDWVVLDALNHIKDNTDGSLSFRWSCRMGVCGSCGMMVNGVPKLTCAAFLRDLVFQLDSFLDKLKSVQPWIVRKEEEPVSGGEYLQSPAQLARFKDFTMCINCMLCYAACPVVGLEPHFLGPAAIALAQRYNLDSRDQGRAQRQEVVASDAGIWQCTFVGECSAVCPKHVDPAGAIQQAKVASTLDWFREVLWPWGQKQ